MNALEFLKKCKIYHTDHHGINELFRLYGGSIRIPVFEQ